MTEPAPNRAAMLVLAYLWPLALVPLLLSKDDDDVQWHAKQGLVLMGAELLLIFVLSVVVTLVAYLTWGLGLALSLLINEAIKTAGIKVDQAKVMERLEELAQQFPDPEKALQTYRSNPQIRRQLESGVLEDQAIDWIVERAKVTDQPSTFKDLMNFGA